MNWKDKRFVPYKKEMGRETEYGVYDDEKGAFIIAFSYGINERYRKFNDDLRCQIAGRLNRDAFTQGRTWEQKAKDIYKEITEKTSL